MIRGPQIRELVDLLDQRGVLLYHSCQYVDFQSYLELGGIPSRKKLSDEKRKFTKFETDREDQKNTVWDKVFLNLQDFGEIFAEGKAGVPTVYGPIHFLIKPEALLEADDVAVALRSAGSPSFDRNKEALTSVEDVDRIFRYAPNADKYKRKKVKWVDELMNEFHKEYVSNPEISISLSSGLLPVTQVSEVLVDSYKISNVYLYYYVKSLLAKNGFRCEFKFRSYQKRQETIINDLTNILLKGLCDLDAILENPHIADGTKDWARQIKQNKLEIQWRRYALYLREGTLIPIIGRDSENPDQPMQSDWGLYKCRLCEKMVIGCEKENHINDAHKGKFVEWKRVK